MGGACLEELEGSAKVVKAASVAWRNADSRRGDGFVSLIGWLTAFVSDTTIAVVEDGALLGSRQLDMGNSGLDATITSLSVGGNARFERQPDWNGSSWLKKVQT